MVEEVPGVIKGLSGKPDEQKNLSSSCPMLCTHLSARAHHSCATAPLLHRIVLNLHCLALKKHFSTPIVSLLFPVVS